MKRRKKTPKHRVHFEFGVSFFFCLFFVSCKCQTVLAGDAERFSLKRQGDKIIRSKVETKKEEEEIQVLLVTAGFQSSRTLDLPASFLRKRPPLPHSCIYSPVDDLSPLKHTHSLWPDRTDAVLNRNSRLRTGLRVWRTRSALRQHRGHAVVATSRDVTTSVGTPPLFSYACY